MGVIKHGKKKEEFNERKIYATCYAACTDCGLDKKYSEDVSEKVVVAVKKWAESKKTLKTEEIAKKVSDTLKGLGLEDCAAVYEMSRVVVKRGGEKEKFDERKVYASCYSACMNCEIEHDKADRICERAASEAKKWALRKKMVNSDEIFKKVIEVLKKIGHEDIAFMYETHRDVS
jgi:transcriptional regulator NrdR family protein